MSRMFTSGVAAQEPHAVQAEPVKTYTDLYTTATGLFYTQWEQVYLIYTQSSRSNLYTMGTGLFYLYTTATGLIYTLRQQV